MRILVLSPYLPHRRVGHGGGTAVRDLVRWTARKHDVRLAVLVRPGEEGLVDEVRELGADVTPLPFRDRRAAGAARLSLWAERARAAARSATGGFPLYVEKYWSPALARRLDAAVAEFAPDAVQVEYLQMSLYVRHLRLRRDAAGAPGPRLVLNTHELGSVPRERRAAAAGNAWARRSALREAAAWRRLQVRATAWADRTLCVTPGDSERLIAMGGRAVETVPLGMDLEEVAPVWDPVAGGETHLFVGSFGHRPNVLAARLLVRELWPAIRAGRPDARLLLAGRGSEEFLAAEMSEGPADDSVSAAGFVDDLTPLYRDCRVFLAPLPEGGGIKIKILEALARGVPVVTTPVGAEGILPDDGDGAAVVAPCDSAFAHAAIELAGDAARRGELAAAGRRLVERHFGWDAITDRLTGIYAGD